MAVRRDWTDAVAHHQGKGCRVCTRHPVELAHILPRTFDRQRGRMQGTIRVHPLAVIPLCGADHRAYDARELDLEPHLKAEEIEHASTVLPLDDVLRRIHGNRQNQ